MKKGKIPEAVLVRSVLKQIHKRRPEVVVSPAVGQDCTAIAAGGEDVLVMSSDPITGTDSGIGRLSVIVTTNDIAAAGADPVGIMLTILLPEGTEESTLKTIMREAEEACEALNVEIMGGHTEITDAVVRTVISVTGVGRTTRDKLFTLGSVKAGDQLVVTKAVGIESTAILADVKGEELRRVFPAEVVARAAAMADDLSVIPESRIAMQFPVTSMHDITEGGIFGALWEVGAGSDLGLQVDLKKIPIRQETIEICEHFDINPYMAMSSGSMLITTPEGDALVEALQAAGINAAVIGEMTEGNGRIITNGEDVRYLDKPQVDELYKALS
ncbi:MAG: AIR synthase family protein [Lachnospiraceae bacterium]|nr:AIR synthase family protein [Lachnospiraceae bacterium]